MERSGVPHLRRSGICSMLRTQRLRAGLTCVAPPALGRGRKHQQCRLRMRVKIRYVENGTAGRLGGRPAVVVLGSKLLLGLILVLVWGLRMG